MASQEGIHPADIRASGPAAAQVSLALTFVLGGIDARGAVLRLPRVEDAALVRLPPFASSYLHAVVREGAFRSSVYFNYTSAGWFTTAGVRVVSGRRRRTLRGPQW